MKVIICKTISVANKKEEALLKYEKEPSMFEGFSDAFNHTKGRTNLMQIRKARELLLRVLQREDI